MVAVTAVIIVTCTLVNCLKRSAMEKAVADFSAKKQGNALDKTLYSLGWKIDELSRLNTLGQQLAVDTSSVTDTLNEAYITVNVTRAMVTLKRDLTTFVKGVTRHKRMAATHILVTMLSPSDRNRKPYALPVCCLPYVGLTERQARNHINAVVGEMTKRKIKVAGMCLLINVHVFSNYTTYMQVL